MTLFCNEDFYQKSKFNLDKFQEILYNEEVVNNEQRRESNHTK